MYTKNTLANNKNLFFATPTASYNAPLAAPIPTPFPNLAFSAANIPAVFNVIFRGGLTTNLIANSPNISSITTSDDMLSIAYHGKDASDILHQDYQITSPYIAWSETLGQIEIPSTSSPSPSR